MDRQTAYRTKVLNELGWLGQYTYEELCITDQLYINGRVAELEREEVAQNLLREANATLQCPCCGYPSCGHKHSESA